jgi:hypothetical protein
VRSSVFVTSVVYFSKHCVKPALACAVMVLISLAAFAAPKVDTIGTCDEASVPDGIKKALAPKGYRVTLDDGSVVELWPRAQVATVPKAREDATYSLGRSSFLGVIHFEKNTRDYRGDAIPAGFYNLRYELQPNDGNHLGTSPTADFLLMVPPGADADPEHTYNFEQLMDLSRQVTAKKHPAPLNLVPAEAKEFPSVTTDPDDHTILFFKVKTQSGELPLALVVKGTTTE